MTLWYVGDRGVCAAATLLAACLLMLGRRPRSRGIRIAWFVLLVIGVANGLALNLQRGNELNPNLSHYYLGAKYPAPYFETYRLWQAALVQPQIGLRDLAHPQSLVRTTAAARRAYYIDRLREAGVSFDPLSSLDSLALRARQAGVIMKESQRIVASQIPTARLESFSRDVRAAADGARLRPLTHDYGYNGSPFYGLVRQADPTLHRPYGLLSAWLNALWQLLGVALLAWAAGPMLGFRTDERLAAAALIASSWDFTGYTMPGLLFTELWVPVAIAAWAIGRGRGIVAGIAIAFAGLLKLFPFLLLLPALVTLVRATGVLGARPTPAARRAAWTTLLVTGVATVALGALATLGGRSWLDFAHKIQVEFHDTQALLNSTSLATALQTLGLAPGSKAPWLWAALSLSVLALLFRGDDVSGGDLPRRTLLLVAAAGWLVTNWLNYYAVIALLLVPAYARERPRAAGAISALLALAYFLPEWSDRVTLAHPWVRVLKLAPYLALPAWMASAELARERGLGRLARAAAWALAIVSCATLFEIWRGREIARQRALAIETLERGNAGESLVHAGAWLQLSPNDAAGRRQAGIALATIGRLDEALPELARSARLAPGDPVTRDDYGRALLMAGRWDDAARELEAARTLSPDDAQVLVMLAQARLRQGRRPEAIGLLQRSRELEPQDAQIAEWLAEVSRP